MNNTDYTYVGKTKANIIKEYFANELNAIDKLPTKLFNPFEPEFVNCQELAINELMLNNANKLNSEIIKDNERVVNNMLDIPINVTVRIDSNTLVKRVPNGWIYFYEIYNNNIHPSVINIVSTFVKYDK